jgi:hypothetical protein
VPNILEIVHNLDEYMVNVCWRAALGFYFGKPIYARVTSVIMQALETFLKKGQSSHLKSGDHLSCVQ